MGVTATGNDLANAISGGQGDDVFNGQAGSDTLVDLLGGNDTYWLLRGSSMDWVRDTLGTADVARFGADIAHDQLWFSRQGNDLVVSVIGTADGLTVSDWYLSVGNGNNLVLETLVAGDGYRLAAAGVDALVSAMSALTPPAAGQTTLSAAQHQQLDGLLGSVWLT